MSIYVMEHFLNSSWGLRSPENRLNFERSYIRKTEIGATTLAEKLTGKSEPNQSFKEYGKLITEYGTDSNLVLIRLECN